MRNLEKPVYVAEGLSFLPPILTYDYVARRATSREALAEILVADLGDSTARSPYLIVSFLDQYVGLVQVTDFLDSL
jgi:cleavage and polyadenylation specificity factor subunit 1